VFRAKKNSTSDFSTVVVFFSRAQKIRARTKTRQKNILSLPAVTSVYLTLGVPAVTDSYELLQAVETRGVHFS
jgi:hypothetical protein